MLRASPDLVSSIVAYIGHKADSGARSRFLEEQLVMLEFYLGTLAGSGLAWPYVPEDLNPRRLASARRALEELVDDGVMDYTADALETAVHGLAGWLVEVGVLQDNPLLESPWADPIGLWLTELPPPQSQPEIAWSKAGAVIYKVHHHPL